MACVSAPGGSRHFQPGWVSRVGVRAGGQGGEKAMSCGKTVGSCKGLFSARKWELGRLLVPWLQPLCWEHTGGRKGKAGNTEFC